MRQKKKSPSVLFPALGLLVLILDSKTALHGALSGTELCLRTVIPSIFPFLFLSSIVTGSLSGKAIPILAPVRKLCKMPKGTEGLLAVGLLGGYPVGAQSISSLYRQGSISIQDAHRLLGFCSNAGPAFIFGMAGALFSSSAAAWCLWGIHILSALAVGMLIPGNSDAFVSLPQQEGKTIGALMAQTVKIMANICGWIILFRVITAFILHWFLWILPTTVQISVIGILELANGCNALFGIRSEAIRFLLVSAYLGFGGICVGMQTVSITDSLGTGWYFPGKLLQCMLSILLSLLIQPFLFPEDGFLRNHIGMCILITALSAVISILINRKKGVAFSRFLVYNS